VNLKSIQKPFGTAAMIWALISIGVCRYFAANTAQFEINLLWLAGLYVLSLCDLVALGKTIEGMIFVADDAGENRAVRALQTFYWALLKLLCLGIFTVVLIKGKSIPSAGLLLGMGTICFVPLLGGLFWSRTAHA
jgi:hypothetical protein